MKWVAEKTTPDVATPVIHNGRVFLARESGVLTCLDAASGEKIDERRYFADRHRSTPLISGDLMYVVDRAGAIYVISADEKMTELSKFETGTETLSSPALANGMLFIRTFDSLYAFGPVP